MNSKEIESNVKRIFEDFSKEEFIFDLLVAYGTSKTSVTRLKKGDFNLSKVDGEILYNKKVFFKEEPTNQLLSSIENHSKEERIFKHNLRFAIVTDFETLVAKDLKIGKNLDIALKDLPKYFDFFLPLAGSEVYNTSNDNTADREAAYKMAQLYDNLINANDIYNSKESIHNLNIFLSRLLFCYFAEDTEIFEEEGIFTNTLAQHTSEDGRDMHIFLNDLFRRLNTKESGLFPVYLARFPYVNGGLFRDSIDSPIFNFKARKTLIELGELNWKDINPDIFGSMIQAVVLPEYRSNLGMHYTSVENIHKLIRPLFLDALYEEFEKNFNNGKELRKLILRISKIKFFDPACGSGNFLIIAYKEIRLFEIKILQRIIDLSPSPTIEFSQIQLTQFYGIEIDDFAHEMAILSLWLAEHQMNRVFEEMLFDYGKSKPLLPLKEAGKIVQGNSTRLDWTEVCPVTSDDEVYIIGNPPYLGSFLQSKEQKDDLAFVCRGFKSYKDLDYIACWFIKATEFIQNKNVKAAFVTTNSICQGEQVILLWSNILKSKIEIFFAYKSFKWTNNAKGNAGVFVTIIGLRSISNDPKKLYDNNIYFYAKDISPYLTSGSATIISKRMKPISKLPLMNYGSKIVDGGNLIFNTEQKKELLKNHPKASILLKKFAGSAEFIKGTERWCLYIDEENLEFAKSIPDIAKRLDAVTVFRLNSTEKSTRDMAGLPHKYYYSVHQDSDSIIIPSTSSERREYIPMGFLNGDTIISNAANVVFGAEAWLFGILTSRMHMVWVRTVGGRLKLDYRYSSQLCYNTFPFPEISLKQKENLNLYVFAILDERAKYPEKTMAQLYDPNTMPKGLRQGHRELDEAIEKCYRLQPFTTDTERLEYLFKLYEEMINKDTLFAKPKKKRKNIINNE
ncbi:MAG TPA: SAM-dependent methyltransferase [Prolixibacteraceae bacterium]|nr:SAM-dependent methyltransferase [Prolixibacteraceae bacterium]